MARDAVEELLQELLAEVRGLRAEVRQGSRLGLTVAEAAACSGIGQNELRCRIAAGKLMAAEIGTKRPHYIIPVSALEAHLAAEAGMTSLSRPRANRREYGR